MAGIHTTFRKTNSGNIVSAFSRLVLPSSFGCYDNDSNYMKGAFPEFFHGFYAGYYGVDAGVLYKNGKWRAFVSPLGLSGWAESATGFSVPSNREIAIRTYLNGDYFILSIEDSYGREIDKVHYYYKPHRSLFTDGAFFNREMTIGVNPEYAGGPIIANKPAYFKDAVFKNTSITLTNGSTIALTAANSNTGKNNLADSGTPTTSYIGRSSASTVNGYVHDTASATYDKQRYPI